MKWPNLIPDWACKTPVEVVLFHGLTEDGEPNEVYRASLMGNYSEKTTRTLDEERRLIELNGTIYFNGDIAPEIEDIDGVVYISGSEKERQIYRSERGRNIDSSVNFTKLELI